MVHISSPTGIGIMIFYSLLTFFITPYLMYSFVKEFNDPCMVGMIIGFTISIILWHNIGKYYALDE